MATVRAAGRSAQFGVHDISRGGALLACNWTLSPDAQLEVDLPSTGGAVPARAVRCEANGLAVVFASDPAALGRIDRALDAVSGRRAAA